MKTVTKSEVIVQIVQTNYYDETNINSHSQPRPSCESDGSRRYAMITFPPSKEL
ncbi:MAG: hypothetical protein K9N09_07460 [Candidatus Cloacimonetes bacterium]|nr:hypothetical protein [Candidatus Cloacimonadota bacterium]MCF7813922.1 hypothetical protein [Candidatus Cloacimonadota bacterium]MCF7868519.1 hypothetical protein [Candidatus Cloacimonadota bacterium]MCF7884034.1 hypothetical protein [Candidatus Cloacimonadota bacterium]